jgi:hypothetical protein
MRVLLKLGLEEFVHIVVAKTEADKRGGYGCFFELSKFVDTTLRIALGVSFVVREVPLP